MAVQSIEYIIFFSIVFVLNWVVCSKNKNFQNSLIAAASIVFYACCDLRFLGLLLFTAFSTFFSGLWMGSLCDKMSRKLLFVGVIVANIGILLYFKYFNFFAQAFSDAFSFFGAEMNVHSLRILLPVGISFYTFTALSYSIDVYQGKVEPTRDVLAYLAYVMFFPSILCGPISRAQKQLPQYYKTRRFDYSIAVSACKLILLGAVMKLCLADRLGIYVDAVYANLAQHNGTTLFLANVLYAIQIYADFAGYSLIAIGCGRLLGIELSINFNRPYFAYTLSDFWRRWHISLTTWFRDYIYFPLGGNRCGKARWICNTIIVFVISGLWHGAAYNFIIWGAIHGVCMVIEKLIYGDKIKMITDKLSLTNLLRLMVTFTIVNFAWIFFRVNNLDDVVTIFVKIFTEPGIPFIDGNTVSMAVVAMILVFIYDFVKEQNLDIHLLSSKRRVIRYLTTVSLIIYVLAFGVLNGGSFIYFQF